MSFLLQMLEHECAPRFNYRCDDGLDEAALAQVRNYELELQSLTLPLDPEPVPEWVHRLARRCCAKVPLYRDYGSYAGNFLSLPTLSTQQLREQPERAVPDDQELSGMMVYYTSGTSASSLTVPGDAVHSSKALVLLERALARVDVRLPRGIGKVALALLGFQSETLTYATTSSYLEGAGYLKLNLNSDDWAEPGDRGRYLQEFQPAVLSGDPISFERLIEFKLELSPRALVSTAMDLSPGLKKSLENHFGCPVLNLYSMTEARMLAVEGEHGFEPLAGDVYLELLDERGRRVPAGQRGEIVITCGRNTFQPLLRYRSGDFARWQRVGKRAVLADFEGRAPVVFQAADGRAVNNIDVTRALRELPLSELHLHQKADLSLELRFRGQSEEREVRACLAGVLGELPLELHQLDQPAVGKVIRYTRDAGDGAL